MKMMLVGDRFLLPSLNRCVEGPLQLCTCTFSRFVTFKKILSQCL
ncbi:hypothetical protein PVAP13_1NG411800 [Panicum virgatum]|uniref:Uncharacterized protein n=1 Tax=Panicum virgatum TaxID=38727 RepID=A0A8T0X353_PANVG|nr:hypothetical protein PVAP13_1NG411800 [Panicum virgatum]